MNCDRFYRTAAIAAVMALGLLVAATAAPAAPSGPYYWDSNGTDPGAGAVPTGTWGVDTFWNADPTGGAANWFVSETRPADDLFFCAGADATGPTAVAVSGPRDANSLAFNYGNVTLSGGTISLTSGSISVAGGQAAEISSVINGIAGLTKLGTGALTLSSANTYTNTSGGTITTLLSAGTLNINNNAALGTSAGLFKFAAGVTIDNTSGGDVALAGNPALALPGGALNFTGTGNSSLNLGNGVVTGSAIPGTTFNIAGGNLTINGNVAAGKYTKNGAGTLTLGGSWGGNGIQVLAGTVCLNNAGAAGGNVAASNFFLGAFNTAPLFPIALDNTSGGPIVISNKVVLDLRADFSYLGTGGSSLTFGDSTTTNEVYLDPDSSFHTSRTMNVVAGTLAFNGRVTDRSATFGLTKAGAGTLLLSSTTPSNYKGATTINGGKLQISGGNDRLPTGTAVTLADAAGAVLDINGMNQTIASLSGGGTTGGNVTLGSGVLTVGNAADTTFDGVLSGTTGGLVKQGSGKLTLTNGGNAYTGATVIKAGTLYVKFAAAQHTAFDTTGQGTDIQGGKSVLDWGPAGFYGDPISFLYPALQGSYLFGWNPPPAIDGLRSTTAAADPTHTHALGWIDDTTALTFTIMYTLYGDSNLDGTVNGTDLNAVLSNYNQAGGWSQGDFNYSGTVDGADLNIVLSNYNQSLSAGAAVPEPSTLLLAAAGLFGLLCYGWRRRK
jgi:fibronectin-binding autotransporter adhesin